MVMVESASSECGGDENKYYNICSELQNLFSIAKFSAPLVFAEGKEYNKAEKLWVFGSCARKEETPESDVDFFG